MKHFMLDLTRDRRSLDRLVFASNGATFNVELLSTPQALLLAFKREHLLFQGMNVR